MEHDSNTVLSNKYLLFTLNRELYGLPIVWITEIIQRKDIDISLLPDQPAYMKGVFERRDKIIPVIDAGVRLENTDICEHDQNCIVLIHVEDEMQYGLLVNSVGGMLDIPECDIYDPPVLSGDCTQRKLITGIARVQTGNRPSLALVLDFQQLASDLNISELQVQA